MHTSPALPRRPSERARDAEAIFRSGIAAVLPAALIDRNLAIRGTQLGIGTDQLDLGDFRRIVIIGAGKASGAMAAALVKRLRPALQPGQELVGWVNVPDDCKADAGPVKLHLSRPAGSNLPTERVVAGTREIVKLVQALKPSDLCFCLISGGGSALLALPIAGVSLEEKRQVSQLLSARGATIQQLNRFRRELSQVKGGRLVAGQQAGRFISLILSDVLGDPLDLIASGPTVVPSAAPEGDARSVLDELQMDLSELPAGVRLALTRQQLRRHASSAVDSRPVTNLLVGSLDLAVAAAAAEARTRGYEVETEIQQEPAVLALSEGVRLASWLDQAGQSASGKARCLISGGEPVVQLGPHPGQGGRNQELVLTGLAALLQQLPTPRQGLNCDSVPDLALLSGGTDGEDGTTTAAGALIDGEFIAHCRALRLDPTPYLKANDSFHFFSEHGGLLMTGLTGTNVGDLRVALRASSGTKGNGLEKTS